MDGEGGAFLIFIRQFFPRFPRFFPTLGKMRDFLGGKGMIFLFSLLFSSLFFLLLTFSQEMPDFSQNHGFFGEVVGKGLFCLGFRSTFATSKKQDNAKMVW